ncbi:MAG: hypothetical protein IAG13_12815, partial [Deltaproteobacteria bacterium]|nr:hypothetical protein [Nannocystaceae bacterium]
MFVSLVMVGVVALAGVDGARAEPSEPLHAVDYEAAPAVFFVATDPIDLLPAARCPVSQSGSDNAGLGCDASLDEAETFVPAADVDELLTGLTTALEPFGVLVTDVRPPPYVPYAMLLVDGAPAETSTSYTCTAASVGCDAIPRNAIARIVPGTANCTDPDRLQSALIAFGSLSGLEHDDDPTDPMYYRGIADGGGPDWSNPTTTFSDMCSNLVEIIDGDDPALTDPLQCPTLYHQANCEEDGQTNSHQGLLGTYGAGPWIEDTTPPVIDALTVPRDGSTLDPYRDELEFDAALSDDNGWVFVRWTLQSPVLIGLPDVDADGKICKSTNRACVVDFELTTLPYYDPALGFPVPEFETLPPGDYTMTLEASDLSGNTIEPVTVSFTVEQPTTTSGDPTGNPTDPSDATASDPTFGPDTDESDAEGGLTQGNGDGASAGDGGGSDGGGVDTSSDGGALDVAQRGCGCVAPSRP